MVERIKSDTYIDFLTKRYKLYYKVNPPQLLKYTSELELCASYNLTETKSSIFSRSLIIYTIKEFEYCFVKLFENNISVKDIKKFTSEITLIGEQIIKPDHDHKSTILTCVIITENDLKENVIDYVKNFKSEKIYRFYMHGWSEVHLILINLQSNSIIHNKKRGKHKKRIEKFYKYSS